MVSVVSTTTTTGPTSNSTSFTANLPASIVSGNLLLVLIVSDGDNYIDTPPTGWSNATAVNNGTDVSLNIIFKTASGSEGSTVAVTFRNSEMYTSTAYQFNNCTGVFRRFANNGPNGDSANPDPQLLDCFGSGGEGVDYATYNGTWATSLPSYTSNLIFIAVCGHDTNRTVTAYPSSYSNGLTARVNSASGCGIGSCELSTSSTSNDPNTFTINITDQWIANTIAIEPQYSAAATTVKDIIGCGIIPPLR